MDVGDIALAIDTALHRPDVRNALVRRGRERVKCFTWERSAERLLGMFSEVLAERSTAGLSWQPIELLEAA